MLVEIGKTYLTRSGERIAIEAETDIKVGRTYQFRGTDDRGRFTWYSAKGRFTRHPHRLDLVREA
jgi:hypothetical protein